MTLHKITLLVDDGWLEAVSKFTAERWHEETCMWLETEHMPTIKCPTCGHESVKDDLIFCEHCGAGQCYWCQDSGDYPCPALTTN